MDSFIISYDLKDGDHSPHRLFMEEAEKQGLLYVWRGVNKVHRLPDTTVWGRFEDIDAARSAFDRAIRVASRRAGYRIKVKKWVIALAPFTMVKSDVAKLPVPKWTVRNAFRTARLHQVNDPDFAY